MVENSRRKLSVRFAGAVFHEAFRAAKRGCAHCGRANGTLKVGASREIRVTRAPLLSFRITAAFYYYLQSHVRRLERLKGIVREAPTEINQIRDVQLRVMLCIAVVQLA